MRGTLDQYISFSAELGVEEMRGTSTGLKESKSRKWWKLVVAKNNEVATRMALKRADVHDDDDGGRGDTNVKMRKQKRAVKTGDMKDD